MNAPKTVVIQEPEQLTLLYLIGFLIVVIALSPKALFEFSRALQSQYIRLRPSPAGCQRGHRMGRMLAFDLGLKLWDLCKGLVFLF